MSDTSATLAIESTSSSIDPLLDSASITYPHTSSLLVEILTEELPAIALLKEWKHVAQKWEQALARFHVPCDDIKHYEFHYTPRRIVIYSRNAPSRTHDVIEEFIGPPLNIALVNGDVAQGLSKAGLGFSKKIGLAPSALLDGIEMLCATNKDATYTLENLSLRITQKDKKDVLYARKKEEGRSCALVLGAVVAMFVRSLNFGKSMRWGDGEEGFIRPIRNIMALFDDKPLLVCDELSDVPSASSDVINSAISAPLRPIYQQECLPATLLHRSFDVASSTLPLFALAQPKGELASSNTSCINALDSARVRHASSVKNDLSARDSTHIHSASLASTPPTSMSIKSSEQWVFIASLDAYISALEQGGVILNEDERKQRILQQIRAIEAEHGIQVELDTALLAHIVAITEYPTALLGRFDARFLALPDEVILTSMKEHQKYFGVYKDKSLYPGFIVVINALTQHVQTIIEGNERVLKARLSDAEFFYHNDRAMLLQQEPLANLAYINGLGSMLDKTHREARIASILARIFGEDELLVQEAISYAKADLLSEMVGEFPELQGIMGYYYVLAHGGDIRVARAIKEQYLPDGEDSPLPSSRLSAIVALSGKLEGLLGLFWLGLAPTGSKDPFALRRAANGVVKIALFWELDIHIDTLLAELASCCGYAMEEGQLGGLRGFLLERLESVLAHGARLYAINEQKAHNATHVYKDIAPISAHILRAALKGSSSAICSIVHNAKALESLQARDDKDAMIAIYKRVANITKDIDIQALMRTDETASQQELQNLQNTQHLRIASLSQSTQQCLHTAPPANALQKHSCKNSSTQALPISLAYIIPHLNQHLFTPIEQELYAQLCALKLEQIHNAQERLEALFSLRETLEEFFALVLVNDENLALRANRKLLLYAIYAEFCVVGDLTELAI